MQAYSPPVVSFGSEFSLHFLNYFEKVLVTSASSLKKIMPCPPVDIRVTLLDEAIERERIDSGYSQTMVSLTSGNRLRNFG